jgi:hypothetical protein
VTHRRLLDIVNQAGDDNLGQTLMRLAQMAAAAHCELAERTQPSVAGSAVGKVDVSSFRKEVER